MKFKFNWGWGIALFVMTFMIFILSLVYRCSQQQVDLVADNYYDREIHYQDHINMIKNSSGLSTPVKFVQTSNEIQILFPDTFAHQTISGTAEFFKPDNAKSDFIEKFELKDELVKAISLNKMAMGKWSIKLTYHCNGQDYFASNNILTAAK